MKMTTRNNNFLTKQQLFMALAFLCFTAFMITVTPAYAAPQVDQKLKEIVKDFVFYIGLIFQVVGVIIAVYSIGQMIMAFKDDNPDAKTRSSTLLVVAIILICLPGIINSLNLVEYITGK